MQAEIFRVYGRFSLIIRIFGISLITLYFNIVTIGQTARALRVRFALIALSLSFCASLVSLTLFLCVYHSQMRLHFI